MSSSLRYSHVPVQNRSRSGLWVYIRVGLFLHVVSLFCLLGLFPAWEAAWSYWEAGSPFVSIFWFWFITFLLSNLVFSQLDARSRYQNYKQIKDQLIEHGFRKLILLPVRKSSCQRSAALIAAEETGHKAETRQFFHELGYRWYHIVPDFLFSQPHFLLSAYFWRTTFFTPTYHPKHF